MIPPSWSGRSAGTGVLRTRCIGCWTSPSGRMTAACATGRLRATSLSFARSLSTWSPGTGAPKPAYVAGARRPPGTTATCSRSSHTKLMREPWRLLRAVWSATWEAAVRAELPSARLLTYGEHADVAGEDLTPSASVAWSDRTTYGVFALGSQGKLV